MAKKIIYSKGTGIKSDFVYVDLLPDVKRSREFNINVIIVITIAVVLSFVFIYIPYSRATVIFEESNGLNNDLNHELLLTQDFHLTLCEPLSRDSLAKYKSIPPLPKLLVCPIT